MRPETTLGCICPFGRSVVHLSADTRPGQREKGRKVNIRTIDKELSHERELLIDDQAVSWLWVIDYQMRIGTAQVRMAGIGGVGTKHEYRMKGYMRALYEDTVKYMVNQGYDVSMLFGIPNFYTKFGYAFCLPVYKQVVQTRVAEEARSDIQGVTVRPLEAGDMAAAVELYNRNNRERTCSIVRSKEHFKEFSKGTWWEVPADAIAFKDKAGQLLAYAALDRSQEEVNVVEAESADDRLFPTLLYEFARMAIDRRCGRICLFHPPDHPFAEFVQRYGCKWKIERHKNGGGMMRILNLRSLFDRIRPELERRMGASTLRAGAGALALKTDIGTVTLAFDNGKLRLGDSSADLALQISQDRLVQLLVGHRSGRDVLNDPAVQATGDVLPWLDALLPAGHPYTWKADQF